ncbi:MAG: DNA polymerase/3'-5' exonuclease PolX [Candidatus Brocadiia bacterium]|jgi:DNA polymerase (family 10)
MRNDEIAGMLETLANLLEFKGENPFKLSAYRRAARVLRDQTEDVATLVRENRLKELPGIGESIEKKIVQALTTGKIEKLTEVLKAVPPGVLRMMEIPGVGPRTAAQVHEKLGINTLREFTEAARTGKLAGVPGIGAKKAAGFLGAIKFAKASSRRMLLGEALPLAEKIVAQLEERGVRGALAAGSLRRMCETIGDIDILAAGAGAASSKIIGAFTKLPEVRRILGAGGTKASIVMESGVQVDLRVVPPEAFGAALQYFTGSKAHNIRLRAMARERGLKLSEYGIFKGNRRIAGRTEEEVYRALKLPLIPPELREDRGEIEAAQKGALPRLIELGDIRGDLHVHTKWSDGRNTIEEMARAARALGRKYIVISDHTRALKIFGGLDVDGLMKEVAAVRAAAKKLRDITLLTGTEMDIRADGTLDLPDSALAKLDFVIASVHSAFRQDKEKMTQRILKAVANPNVDCIGHLTGRLLGRREGYAVDVEAVLKAAARNGTAIELNANPLRLDLTDQACRRAKELGVQVVINTDAHSTEDLQLMRYGVATAQRGWLEKSNVLNARATPPKGKGAR